MPLAGILRWTWPERVNVSVSSLSSPKPSQRAPFQNSQRMVAGG